MTGWILTVVLALASGAVEERVYRGFTSQDECLKSIPFRSGGSVSNWGTTGDVTISSSVLDAWCAPDPGTVQICSVERPCSADLDGNGDVNANDYKLFLKQFKPEVK